MTSATPAIEALLAARRDLTEWDWAQALVGSAERGYDLRHTDDRGKLDEELKSLRIAELRMLAQNTQRGEFRPLKCAPDLVNGWRAHAATSAELETALNSLYPGSIADWFAMISGRARVTQFREFAARQSGMYRIAAMLSPAQASQTIRATCGPAGCLKRRLWSVEDLPADADHAKSAIPCLEPCAVLLEFARKAMRIEQQKPLDLALRPDDAASAVVALEQALRHVESTVRAAEVSSPANALRMRLALEKIRDALALAQLPETSDE